MRSHFGSTCSQYFGQQAFFSMADSTLASSQQLIVKVSIPAGYLQGFSPEEQQYADTLDYNYVLDMAQQWLVSHKQVPDFINLSAITIITFWFFLHWHIDSY